MLLHSICCYEVVERVVSARVYLVSWPSVLDNICMKYVLTTVRVSGKTVFSHHLDWWIGKSVSRHHISVWSVSQTVCIVSNNHQSGLSPATIFSEVSPNIIWILNLKLKTVCLLTHSVASPDNIFIECVLRQVCLVCLLTLCVCIVSQQHLSRVSFHTIWSVALELQMECLLTPSVWSPVCARPPRWAQRVSAVHTQQQPVWIPGYWILTSGDSRTHDLCEKNWEICEKNLISCRINRFIPRLC